MPPQQPQTPTVRLAELMAALSLATILGMGQPLDCAHFMCPVCAARRGA